MWDMHKRITLNWYFLCQEDYYYYLLLHSASKSSQDTMQHQEKYTLQWKSYSDHLRKVLREKMTSSEFADVTLVTDDKKQIRAHQNILFSVLAVQFSRVFSKLIVKMLIQFFTSEEFSNLKLSQ